MSSRPVVLILDHDMPSHDNPDLRIEKEILGNVGCDVVLGQYPRYPRDETRAAIIDFIQKSSGPVVAIVSQGCLIDKPVLVEGAAKSLRVVGRYGTGIDVVDLEAAKELGIAVRWIPDYSVTEVSDQAIALLMALNRKLIPTYNVCLSRDWSAKNANDIHRSSTQVVGVMGYGLIGQEAARKAAAIGFETICYDPIVDPNDTNHPSYKKAQRDNVKIVTLDEIHQRADYISLHIPSLPSTKHFINSAFLEKCKPQVSIINTGRGALIDESALLKHLQSGHVKGAALDVREVEPANSKDDPLIGLPNVVLTPHTGYVSIESRTELKTRLASEIAAVLKGEEHPLGPRYGRA